MRTAAAIKLVILEDASRWTVKDIALLLLGTLISFYATVVFERYKRFGEMLRDTARSRELSLEYPPTYAKWAADLEIAYRRMTSFYEELEKTTWSLEVDGHVDAARKLAHLQSFMDRAARCVDRMINGRMGNLTPEEYLEKFRVEYKRIFEANFQGFEEHLWPNWGALLQIYPHRPIRISRVTNQFDYFDQLLNLTEPPPKMHI
jgi:hypothetical protein